MTTKPTFQEANSICIELANTAAVLPNGNVILDPHIVERALDAQEDRIVTEFHKQLPLYEQAAGRQAVEAFAERLREQAELLNTRLDNSMTEAVRVTAIDATLAETDRMQSDKFPSNAQFEIHRDDYSIDRDEGDR